MPATILEQESETDRRRWYTPPVLDSSAGTARIPGGRPLLEEGASFVP
jgi:hypothetical protein